MAHAYVMSFRAEDLPSSWSILVGLGDLQLLMPRFSPLAFGVLFLGYAIHFTPSRWAFDTEAWFRKQRPAAWVLMSLGIGALTLYAGTGDSLAFVYYQF